MTFLLLLFSSRIYQNTGNLYFFGLPILIWLIFTLFLKIRRDKNSALPFVWFIPFLLWNMISALWSENPGYSIERAVYTLFITTGFLSAGFLFSDYLKEKFTFLYIILIPLVLISLVSLFTGLPENSWTGGNALGFMGYVSHQNTLGAALIFTIPVLFFSFIEKVRISDNKIRILIANSILLIAALYLLINSHSRSAVLAFIIFFILFALISLNRKNLIYIVPAVVIGTAFIIFSPFGEKMTDYAYKSSPSVLSTRQQMINVSIEGAKRGGLTGLGYGMSHRDSSVTLAGDHERNGIFVREKGISSLGLIEETGVIGLILFLLIYIPLYFNLKNSYNFTTRQKLFIIAILIMYSLHAQAEAWWVGAGSLFYQIHFFMIGYLIKES